MLPTRFRLNRVQSAIAGAAAVALPLSALFAVEQARAPAQPENPPAVSTPLAKAPTQAALPDFSGLAEQYGPAVVNISVQGTMRTAGTPMPEFRGFGPDDPFSQFFRNLPRGERAPQPIRGMGSGFIISPDGVILTNAHVVADAKTVTVKLTDRREFEAKVLGTDEASDVAVLKIEARDLPSVRLGNPADVRVGEWVVAIGAPFGFENTVTAGIVSAKGRTLEGYVPFLQTDVAVNPGNSGGPLFNLRGEVVGINSQIYSRTGGYQGVSFAIPIDVAVDVSQQLRTTGHVSRGKLGVTIQGVNQGLAESFGLSKPEGALVSSVEPGSAAQKAGIQPGDVIVSFNGKPVRDSNELPARVAALKPGTDATVQVWRDRKLRELRIRLDEVASREVASVDGAPSPGGKLGLQVRPLTPQEAAQVQTEGLLVDDVEGPAADAGIQPGDIVLSANGTAVKSVEELRGVVSQAKDHIALLVQRDGRRLFVPIELS